MCVKSDTEGVVGHEEAFTDEKIIGFVEGTHPDFLGPKPADHEGRVLTF